MTKTPYSTRIKPELLEEIRVQAKKEIRSVNNLIEVALSEYLKTKASQKK